MQPRDKQDVDTNTGQGDPASDIGPTSGHAASPSTQEGLGLGGLTADEATTEQDDLSADFGTGLETGNAARGSSTNAAERVDTFNTPNG